MKRAKKILIGGLIGAGIGGGFAAGDEAIDYSEVQQERLREAQIEQELTQQQLDEIEARLGESCVAAIRPYLGGGELRDIEEDSVVQDIALNGENPCGENPTNIRTSYRQ